MKVAFLVTLLVASALASNEISSWLQEERAAGRLTGSDEGELQQFMNFAHTYKVTYSSKAHMLARLSIFRDNLKKIEFANKLEDGATYGVTQFADLSEEEFLTKYTGMNNADEYKKLVSSFPKAADLPTDDIPSSFDWREKGAVTPVKNQAQCGSCWAFATTGNVEGVNFLKNNKLVSLSEQNLVDCDKKDQGCGGGLPLNAYEYIKDNGLNTEEDYPYKGADGTCKYDASKAVAKITGGEQTSTDEDQIAAYLVKNGPLAIGINATWMQFYFGGISNPLFCSPKKLDHGVLIVGFGEQSGKKYWIIKNSWGASWGEKGYYRIIRGKGKCGVNTMVTSAQM